MANQNLKLYEAISYQDFHNLVNDLVKLCNNNVTPEFSYVSEYEWEINLFQGPFKKPFLRIFPDVDEGKAFMKWHDDHYDSIPVLSFQDVVKQYNRDVEIEIKKWESMRVKEVNNG